VGVQRGQTATPGEVSSEYGRVGSERGRLRSEQDGLNAGHRALSAGHRRRNEVQRGRNAVQHLRATAPAIWQPGGTQARAVSCRRSGDVVSQLSTLARVLMEYRNVPCVTNTSDPGNTHTTFVDRPVFQQWQYMPACDAQLRPDQQGLGGNARGVDSDLARGEK
jgi:hypothetical protein